MDRACSPSCCVRRGINNKGVCHQENAETKSGSGSSGTSDNERWIICVGLNNETVKGHRNGQLLRAAGKVWLQVEMLRRTDQVSGERLIQQNNTHNAIEVGCWRINSEKGVGLRPGVKDRACHWLSIRVLPGRYQLIVARKCPMKERLDDKEGRVRLCSNQMLLSM